MPLIGRERAKDAFIAAAVDDPLMLEWAKKINKCTYIAKIIFTINKQTNNRSHTHTNTLIHPGDTRTLID